MALYTVFASLSVSVSFVFAVKSIYILATHGKQSWMCQPLEVWLMVCCAALTLSALTLGITDILVVAWSMRGEFIRANLPETCRDTGPDIWSFPDEALGVGIFAFACALMCVMTGWYMVRQLRRIHDFVADTEIQRTINSLALFTHTNADLRAQYALTTLRAMRCGEDCLAIIPFISDACLSGYVVLDSAPAASNTLKHDQRHLQWTPQLDPTLFRMVLFRIV